MCVVPAYRKGRSAIAIAQTVKHTPPFIQGPTYVRLYEISPETLENERLFNNQLGSTSNYTATFEHFLESSQPPSVVAW
ncbi:MAG TPA: hypothetical protein VLQ93_06260 [Myxococcaceae bacterium]|nr:hypothetical protein [Myxococcaceae bacterium]